MGYKKLKNGGYEQPHEAFNRVQRRSVVNIVAAFAVAAATATGIYYGVEFTPSSPPPVKNDQIYQYEPSQDGKNSGYALLCFMGAGLIGVIGGGIAAARIIRDERSKNSIRRDIQDGIIVDENGRSVFPGHFVAAETTQDAAPR